MKQKKVKFLQKMVANTDDVLQRLISSIGGKKKSRKNKTRKNKTRKNKTRKNKK